MAPTTSTSCIGKAVSELETPSFLVDLEKVTKNCQAMKDSCKGLELAFRPCTNTHRTLEASKLQTVEKEKGIMCRSLHEVEHLASNGFDDILYGFPLLKAHMPRISKLAEKLTSLHLTVDNCDAVCALKDTAPPSGKTWSVLLMVDCGAKREGVWWEAEDGVKLAQAMKDCEHITFKGVYAFCGNSYEGTEADLEKTRDEAIERLLKFVERLTAIDVKCTTIGLGGTPVCKTSGPNMKKLTELHSGNYIFNDLQQCTLGTKRDDIACTIATRVVGHYPHRKQMLVDCGENGLSTSGNHGSNNKEMGYALVKEEPNFRVSAVYQDLGVVEAVSGDMDFSKYPIGSVIQLLPWHSCGTSLLYNKYHVIGKDGKVAEEWSPISTC
ncbi:unnamed protein product [Meganyctiphanes norvegica]|uniref:D-serine dehydratase-like domain-containing protein n=1 Tax=Meganyctiphanes norvegica TaxID=48144 RepID=A0AAV2SKZ6_MEGNR